MILDAATKSATRAWLDHTRGPLVRDEALAKILAASPHAAALDCLASFTDNPSLKTAASRIVAMQLSHQAARIETTAANSASYVDLRTKWWFEEPDYQHEARNILDRAVRNHEAVDELAISLDTELDAFFLGAIEGLHALDTRWRVGSAQWRTEQAETEAEHARQCGVLRQELADERAAGQATADRLHAHIDMLKRKHAEEMESTREAMARSLEELECTWSTDVQDFLDAAEYAAALHEERMTVTQFRHEAHMNTMHTELRRERAQRESMRVAMEQLEAEVQQVATHLLASKALTEGALQKKISELKAQLAAKTGSANNEQAQRLALAKEAKALDAEVARLRQVQVSVLASASPRDARQRLYFESLKAREQTLGSASWRGTRSEPLNTFAGWPEPGGNSDLLRAWCGSPAPPMARVSGSQPTSTRPPVTKRVPTAPPSPRPRPPVTGVGTGVGAAQQHRRPPPGPPPSWRDWRHKPSRPVIS